MLTDIQADTQTDILWQKCRKLENQAGRQKQRHTEKTDRQTDRHSNVQVDRLSDRTTDKWYQN